MHLHNQCRALIVTAMNTRVQQRETTRASILQAALEEFSEKGFDGTSTRLIAAKAGVHHALIKYHFQSKDALWKAAVTFLFERQIREVGGPVFQPGDDPRQYARDVLRHRALYWARHPEHARLMVQESCRDTEQFRWMVDQFVVQTSQFTERFIRLLQAEGVLPDVSVPSLAYILAGASQLFFTLAPEVRRVWGVDPMDPQAVEDHIDALVRVLLR